LLSCKKERAPISPLIFLALPQILQDFLQKLPLIRRPIGGSSSYIEGTIIEAPSNIERAPSNIRGLSSKNRGAIEENVRGTIKEAPSNNTDTKQLPLILN